MFSWDFIWDWWYYSDPFEEELTPEEVEEIKESEEIL